jgi:CRISPR-associated protein Cmr1
MPAPIRRSRRREPAHGSFSVEIETVTPILGGAPETRTVDVVDTIRVPTIRGHLRFWWRALQRDLEPFSDPAKFAAAEAVIWGKAADDKGGRSPVEITVEVRQPVPRSDPSDIDYRTPGAYALWPAMRIREKGKEQDPALRYPAGVRFRLTLSAPETSIRELQNVVRAWLLFGGYGSRTRRGLGSLKLVDRRAQTQWLPSIEDPDDIEPVELQREFNEACERLFGRNVLGAGTRTGQTPSLAGAMLLIGGLHRGDRAQQAWLEALHWLRDFRQQPGLARERGSPPGQSRWAEADKLRHLTGKYGHQARYADRTAAWPRAAFGLPIVGRFLGTDEPDPFVLNWQIDATEAKPGEERIKDRLASPLIVKPLQTVEGFYPCALWLNRAAPPGEVVAVGLPHSNAPFGFLGTRSDLARAADLGAPFARKPDVKTAFFDWVKTKDGVVQVAP